MVKAKLGLKVIFEFKNAKYNPVYAKRKGKLFAYLRICVRYLNTFYFSLKQSLINFIRSFHFFKCKKFCFIKHF